MYENLPWQRCVFLSSQFVVNVGRSSCATDALHIKNSCENLREFRQKRHLLLQKILNAYIRTYFIFEVVVQ